MPAAGQARPARRLDRRAGSDDQALEGALVGYYAPKNFNFWYYFGSIALFVLALQIVTGIFLTMSYKPSATEAFGSVEYIMRDVEWGWLIRLHALDGRLGASSSSSTCMFRALLYGCTASRASCCGSSAC